jgi:acyl-CoA thioesterase-1
MAERPLGARTARILGPLALALSLALPTLTLPTRPTLALPARPAAAAGRKVTLLAFGDSLTAGYGLPADQGFTARLAAALAAKGIDARVINGGLSGDTSAGGRARLEWALAAKPDAAIVELGANDGLRGLDPAATKANLDAILATLHAKGVRVLFTGMYAPPNLGPDYAKAFNGLFPALAEKHGVLFYPFFLEGVAADPALNQPDGIHPNAKGVDVIVARILPYVLKLIGE